MALNQFCVWKPEFNLGIPVLDAEHQWFFEIINNLYRAMCAGAGAPEMNAIATALEACASAHFAHEEQFLEELSYPGVGGHRKEHEGFMRELGNLSMDSSSCEALGFLKDWLLNHILGADRQYLAYTKSLPSVTPRTMSTMGLAKLAVCT